MGEPGSVKSVLKLEGWKRNKKKLSVLCLLWLAGFASALDDASGGDDDDSVNVISVENLDALLGLRMVNELNLKNLTGAQLSPPLQPQAPERSRRSPSSSARILGGGLCGKRECTCESHRVSCHFRDEEVLDIAHGSIPWHAQRLVLTNLTELRVLPGALHDNPNLTSVTLRDIGNVTVGKDIFRRSVARPHFNFDVTNCGAVTLHERSLRNAGGLLRATIDNCESVTLGKSFTPLTVRLRVSHVGNLEMESYAFYVEVWGDISRTTVDIAFHNVTVKVLPSWTFKLSGARITFAHSAIDIVDTEAFRALQLESVHFRDTTVRRFETEAFSTQTSIKDVELDGVNVQYVAGQALTAATNLTIRRSRIKEISDGAFNITAAFVRLTSNAFHRIGRHAFAIQSWNSIVIDGNEFEFLKQDAFAAPFAKVENVANEFVFSDNVVNGTEVNALSFVPSHPDLEVIIRNNTFQELCHCHLESWVLTLSSTNWKALYDTSNCRIGEFGACYDLDGEYMDMRNYTAAACGSRAATDCHPRRVGEYDLPTELDLKNTERTIFGVIFLGVASSVAIMLVILSLSWLRRRGTCGSLGKYVTPSGPCCFAVSQLCNTSNLVTSSSISRINIHEYAEIQYQMTEQQKQTILGMNGGLVEEGGEEVIVVYEDKATQTLPEELTQELLQTLREKLDDPENYNEARNMIEHLYDLIKVEESCNNNSRTSLHLDGDDDVGEEEGGDDVDDDDDEEVIVGGNVYDVITRRPRKRSKRVRKVTTGAAFNVRSTGTRVPSPDKLSPVAFRHFHGRSGGAVVTAEYAEPRDRKSNEYCELPGSREGVMPDVLATGGRGVGRMEGRPLPCKPGTSDAG